MIRALVLPTLAAELHRVGRWLVGKGQRTAESEGDKGRLEHRNLLGTGRIALCNALEVIRPLAARLIIVAKQLIK
jgi:hypothetical protein